MDYKKLPQSQRQTKFLQSTARHFLLSTKIRQKLRTDHSHSERTTANLYTKMIKTELPPSIKKAIFPLVLVIFLNEV